MIEVFKTNITKREEVKRIQTLLAQILPESYIHVDLEDCDRILRIECGYSFNPCVITREVQESGFECEVLDDSSEITW